MEIMHYYYMTFTDQDVKELGQYTAILTSLLVNTEYIYIEIILSSFANGRWVGWTVARCLHMYLSGGSPFILEAGIRRDKTRQELYF